MSLDARPAIFRPVGQGVGQLKERERMAEQERTTVELMPKFQTGWLCPKCNKGNAPWANRCGHCAKEENGPEDFGIPKPEGFAGGPGR